MSVSEILFRRRRAVTFVTPKGDELTRETFTVISELEHMLERLGFTLDDNALCTALRLPGDAAKAWSNELLGTVRRSLGAHVKMAPMYPNFPRQVEGASDAELYLNAVLHYLGDAVGLRIMPEYTKKERPALVSARPLTVLTFVKDADSVLREIALQLCAQAATWSDVDLEDVCVLHGAGLKGDLFTNFKNRANFAAYAALADDVAVLDGARSVTDVLRVALALSGQSPEFVKGSKFGPIARRWRKALVLALNRLAAEKAGVEDIRRRLGLWKLLGERLHVGEYRDVAPAAVALFDSIRSNGAPRSLRGQIQTAAPGVELDAMRAESPSEFARDLDWALRSSDNPERTLDAFRSVASQVPTRILWQVLNALENRDAGIRMFLPKGNAMRAQFSHEALPALSASVIEDAKSFVYEAILAQYALLPSLGKVTVDAATENYAVPFQVRTAGLAHRPLGRGSRIPVKDSEFIRFFMWWKDVAGDDFHSRVDLDMSLSFMDEDFAVTSEVAYYNLRNGVAVHSGDITSAPNGAAEFIDISHEALAKENGARYVAMSVYSYTGHPFNTIPEALAGVMLRENLDQGEVFEAKTVETAFSLTQDAVSVVPFVYDIEKRELIWLDAAARLQGWAFNAGHTRTVFSQMVEAAVKRKMVTVHDVLTAHAEARGAARSRKVTTLGEDIAFSPEIILSDWL